VLLKPLGHLSFLLLFLLRAAKVIHFSKNKIEILFFIFNVLLHLQKAHFEQQVPYKTTGFYPLDGGRPFHSLYDELGITRIQHQNRTVHFAVLPGAGPPFPFYQQNQITPRLFRMQRRYQFFDS
jgi:hypothetical protein